MSRKAEFRRGWPTLLAATLGVGLGVSGLAIYSAGLFVNDLGREFGLTRTTYGLAYSLLTLGMAAAVPVIGYAVDRFGVKIPTITSAVCLAAGFVLLGTAVHSVPAYMTAMALIGFFGAGSGPIAFTRAVSSWFDRARGFALGITMMGMGLAGALVPIAISSVIGAHGWQTAYIVLACAAAVGTLPTLLLLRSAPPSDSDTTTTTSTVDDGHSTSAPEPEGPSFAVIRRDRLFWQLIGTFGLMSVAFTGLVPHLVPMLRQAGTSASTAALIASLMGISVIVSRLVVGFLFDVFRPQVVAASLCGLCTLGVLAFAFGGVALAPVAAVAVGCMLGAELDMLGFFTSRYFGMAAFGRAYAGPYAAFVIGGAIAPLWVGAVADQADSYRPALLIVTVLTLLVAGSFLALPNPNTRIERLHTGANVSTPRPSGSPVTVVD
ncbi:MULTISPECIES: MFS transporter [unclassified Rhodococcus (in: high G+C Gram-positive bacteria)]|uniref:MFS transporter n=1 Tax=unclassified Rhodococcus (in: high G+C Gram-positive bacteria) TaxID=192944 RepID=UPI00163ACD4B|nr:MULTISPECIES: MFS transporter [unclassified Rhodococcus (in: high G+C Gram-positive bacteria)]MBC2640889.1 MFS transporter [Rhodococcus sp. 3A]MBC2894367.1 MFS transporter [Rhodococcus sp. 4CII]